jgi:hypothetical protein
VDRLSASLEISLVLVSHSAAFSVSYPTLNSFSWPMRQLSTVCELNFSEV